MFYESSVDELNNIIKVAINRATKELIKGELSPGTLGTIRGVLDKARPTSTMTAGLNRGSEAIAKKLNVPIHEVSYGELVKDLMSGVKGHFKEHGLRGGLKTEPKLPEGVAENAKNTLLATFGGGGVTMQNPFSLTADSIALLKNQPIMAALGTDAPKGIRGTLKKLKNLVRNKDLSQEEKDYLSAVIKRHEVDEAIAMASPKSYMSRKGESWTPGWEEMGVPGFKSKVLQGGGLHGDPRVLLEESRHVTRGPEKIRGVMERLREDTLEAKGMKDLAGVHYGRSTPPAGTRGDAKAIADLYNIPKTNYKDPLGIPYHIPSEFSEEAIGKARSIVDKVRGVGKYVPGSLGEEIRKGVPGAYDYLDEVSRNNPYA